MNRREAAQLLEMRQILWPHTQPPGDPVAEVELWAALLADFDLETCAQAMRSKRSNEHAPLLGQIEEAIRPTPTYADALDEFKQMVRRHSTGVPASKIAWSHPLIAAFAERHWAEWGQSPDGTYDGLAQSEAAARAHFRESFKAVQQRWSAGAITAGRDERAALGEGRQLDAGD